MYKSVCTNTDKAWITFCVFSFGVFFPESIKYECKNVMLVTAMFYLDDLFPPLVFHYPFFPSLFRSCLGHVMGVWEILNPLN